MPEAGAGGLVVPDGERGDLGFVVVAGGEVAAEVTIRWRGSFGYLIAWAGEGGDDDEQIALCRIEYPGDDEDLGLALYDPATETYTPAMLRTGEPRGRLESSILGLPLSWWAAGPGLRPTSAHCVSRLPEVSCQIPRTLPAGSAKRATRSVPSGSGATDKCPAVSPVSSGPARAMSAALRRRHRAGPPSVPGRGRLPRLTRLLAVRPSSRAMADETE